MPRSSEITWPLSGGNQQKAIFARWITGSVRILLLDEPTHGVDIRSKAEIYHLVRELAAQGVAIVLVTSELEEIETLCHRTEMEHSAGKGVIPALMPGGSACPGWGPKACFSLFSLPAAGARTQRG
jgi:ABC-type sugar transport system ATPase subunit